MRHGTLTRRGACALLLLAILAGCSDDDLTTVESADPADTFDLTGRVLSLPGDHPLADATWTLVTTGETGACDTTGVFHLTGLAEGTHQLTVQAPGHAATRFAAVLGRGDAGKTRHAHRDIRLARADRTLQVQVLAQDEPDPPAGADVRMVAARFPTSLPGHILEFDADAAAAVTDTLGRAVLTGLPSVRVHVEVRAPGREPGLLEVDLSREEIAARTVVLEEATGAGPVVYATNVPGSRYARLEEPQAWLLYSAPMDPAPGRTTVTLNHDDYPYDPVPVEHAWASPTRLEVTPLAPLEDPDADYDLVVEAHGVDGGLTRFARTFYWTSAGVVPGCNEVVGDLTLIDGHPPIDHDTTTLLLRWTAVACAGGYRIHARDNHRNPDWVHVADEPADYASGEIRSSCTLPASFDLYDVDGVATPLAGIDVEVAVVPLRAVDPAPDAGHAVLAVRDEVAPGITGFFQTGRGVNTGTRTQRLSFVVTFSEYIAEDAADPAVVVAEAGGDPGFALDPAQGSWTWEQGRSAGRLTFLLAPGDDASGDLVRLEFDGLVDLAGNAAGPAATPDHEVVLWGDTFDFEDSPQGWEAAGDGWAWGSPQIGPASAHSGSLCWGLSLSDVYGANWTATLTSPEIHVCPDAPVLSYWCWYDLDPYDDYVRVYVVAWDGTSTALTYYHQTQQAWEREEFDLSDWANEPVRLRFEFTSDGYDQRAGFFLDDVEVGCSP